jgi:hypothetical protein
MGDIERIDMVSKTTEQGEKFNRVFIHFRKWASDGNAVIARERLVNGKEIKIVYDEPWFWKVSAYRKDVPKNREPHKSAPRPHEAKKPSFCFESQESQYQQQNQQQYQCPRQPQNQYQSKYQNKYQAKYQNKRPAPPKERKVEQARSPSSSPPPPPTSPVPIQDAAEEGPTGEYLDVPKVEYGKISFPKRKGLKTKVALTIVNPDEITLE